MSGEINEELEINIPLKATELNGKIQEINENLWKIQERIKRLEIKLGKQQIKEETKSNYEKFRGSLISKLC